MNYDLIRKIDFGEIDGYGDPNLEKYFLDNGYWEQIIDDKVFFVVGKKGTGKSSIYRMIERESLNKGCIVVNKDFGEFPFEKLLKLNDESFAKPNQYQTIWKNVIFDLFVQAIAKLPNEDNCYYDEIKEYNSMYLENAVELHKDIISKTIKKEGNLFFNGFFNLTAGRENARTYKYNDGNITAVNASLNDLIINYFLTCNSDRKVIVQFDRLDDNYNQYQDLEEYYQAMISLFKVVYNFNQSLRSKKIFNAKVILYIRSDIMRAMASRDAESARWDGFRIDLNWNVNNMREIYKSDLYRMVEKRIQTSCDELSDKSFKDVFYVPSHVYFDGTKRDLFRALVLQTLFRPRDLINLLKTLQKEIDKSRTFNDQVYKETLKKYANWLVNTEIANEINPVLREDYKYVIELLRLCGSRDLSVTTFTERYNAVKHNFKLSPLELLEFLYSVGIIENTWKDKTGKPMHRSIFRNEGDFDRNLQLKIIPAVWSGLTV
ncbi:hypothetical protein J6Y50_10465 [bacterium]|nr:hypothetical protein [bacterium]